MSPRSKPTPTPTLPQGGAPAVADRFRPPLACPRLYLRRLIGRSTAAARVCAALGAMVFALLVGTIALAPRPARALELCGEKSLELMRGVGITDAQIRKLCQAAEEASRLTRLSLRRTEDEAGYCRVILALRNDSIHHIDSFVLTSEDGRFDIFQFRDIIAGGTGFASGLSRHLMECAELEEIGVSLIWPGTVRVDGRPLSGRLLDQYMPALQSKELRWKP